MLHKWSSINRDHPIRNSIANDWQTLLDDQKNNEEIYHRFLAEHAGFFFGNPFSCLSCISKLDLGADYETDFILPRDEGSHGFVYEFIEIESPHSRAFTKARQPSQRLITAIQQVTNWKDWITQNQNAARKLFPSNTFLLFGQFRASFTIIIDRRSHLELVDNLRLQQEKAHGISIRSFDSLSDWISRCPSLDETLLASSEERELSSEQRNMLANPFYSAMSGQTWRKLVSTPKFQTVHMYILNAQHFLDARTYNKHLDSFLSSTDS